jgi:hypothetical protein
MQNKIVLLSHFYNEEFLLPHWIKHHKNMFDDVVLVNYQSTDASVDIIKAATDWEIRDSRNDVFDCRLVDVEVMDIEREFKGYWKVVLNTTEFLLFEGMNLHEYIAKQIENKPEALGFSTTGVWLIDSIDDKEKPINDDVPLILQRFNGFVETGVASRQRLIHRADCGLYTYGRHTSLLPNQLNKDIFCVWFGWCPYHHIKKRKLQIKNRIPPEHFGMGWGVEHNIKDEEELDVNFYRHTRYGYDLRTNESYAKCINYMQHSISGYEREVIRLPSALSQNV